MIHNLTTTLGAASGAGGGGTDAQRERLAMILDEYLLGLERGEPIEPEALLSRHPDVANQLHGYLSGLALFHQAVANRPPQSAMIVSGGPGLGGSGLGGQLGDFQLVREIGRGGMGIVYEAVQVSLGRRVAVKVLPFAAAIDEKQITRFKNEAQAAAQIDHPHIVPVFAIGQEHGIHFFAMQLVGGQSLAGLLGELRDEDKEGANLSGATGRTGETHDHVMAVARMGVQAAEALDAAHEIGVVHRDVKPSNLLLDEKGKVWVTDFGVARCKSSACLTETGHVLGSLPYMSPEQASGQPALVDHRTDIYSLGVTLYELATLRHPGEGTGHAATTELDSRSKWRRPRFWNSSIPVDFENIVLKAMADARDERYATARELAEDLERFLDGQPILARRPSLCSRVEKWVWRHKRSVAAAMGVLAMAAVGIVASLVIIASERADKDAAYRAATANHARAEKNYERAEAKFQQAREVLDRFGARVNQLLANKLPGAEAVRQELLAEMLPYYRAFAREAADDPALQADLALTYSKIGYLSDQLGSQADAEQAYAEARAIHQRLAQAQPWRREHLRNVALCCNNLGQVLQKRGAMAAAREALDRAHAIQQQLASGSPPVSPYHADLAATESNLGLLFNQTDHQRQAAMRFRAAIRIQESIRQADPQNETNLINLATSYNNLSSVYLPAQPAVARQWVERALSLQLQLAKQHPHKRDYQSDLALSYNNLGAIHARLDRWSLAELCYRDAIAIQERLAAAAPLVTSYQRDLAVTFNNLGMSQTSAGSLGQAEVSFDKALAIQQDLVEAQPQNAGLLSGLGGIYYNLGIVQQQNRQMEAAVASFEKAIATQRRAYEQSPDIARFREALSKHYYNYAEALRALDRPVEAAEVVLMRRNLWPGDGGRLLRIAEELAATCRLIPSGDARKKYIDETTATLDAAMKAGLSKMPDLRSKPFDVLLADFSTAAAGLPGGPAESRPSAQFQVSKP
ncbi:MAG: protein kinase [Planctomycetaceae bacterium]|nr:protein kinase [Planctomycetaceae bacterium]